MDNFIFTGEMRIELYRSRRAYVRRNVSTRYRNEYVCKTVKFGGRSLLLWGVIKEDGSRILFRCPSVMNSSAYHSILHEGLRDIYGRDSVLMHDGAPCNRSVSTKLYLERKKICYIYIRLASTVSRLEHPDLNIEEMLPRGFPILLKSCGKLQRKNGIGLMTFISKICMRLFHDD